MGLSLLILIGYPFIIRFIYGPEAKQNQTEQNDLGDNEENNRGQAPVSFDRGLTSIGGALDKPEGPFIEKTAPPVMVSLENNLYDLQFSTLGATVTSLHYKGEEGKLGPTENHFFETRNKTDPGIFGIRFGSSDVDLSRAVFKVSKRDAVNSEIEFSYELPSRYLVTKAYALHPGVQAIEMRLQIKNLAELGQIFPVEFIYGMDTRIEGGLTDRDFEVVGAGQKIESAHLDKVRKKGHYLEGEFRWTGILRKYFALLVKPSAKTTQLDSKTEQDQIFSILRLEPVSVGPGETTQQKFLIYAGSQRYQILKAFDVGFEDILSRGFFGTLKFWFLMALKFCNQFTHNFGWAIILLTLAIKAAFTPLTHLSFESMKKMQALQPKLKNLQERYKNDPTKLNHEMMQLYKRNKVNPMSGCLPMVLQIPIFIAFYQVLSETIEMKGAPFIGWINDLSVPDRLFSFPVSIPFIGDGFHLLPLLMLGSMVWQQKLTPTTSAMMPEQEKMMQFMPIIFGFMFYNVPSGLVLYWFVNNMLSIIHQIFVKRIVVVLHHEDRE